MKESILKYALHNAALHGGKANQGAVIGKVIAEHPEAKQDMKKLAREVATVIREISPLTTEQQLAKLKEIAPQLLEKKEREEKDIFAFLGIRQGQKVVTCFPPEPSKYPHIGHAKAILLNYELARRYKGTFILRFEDTNPLLAEKHLYPIHKECYAWLGISPDKVENASEYMDEFYTYAEQLIEQDAAYLCTCAQETIKENRFKGIECACRANDVKKNKELWKVFFTAKEEAMVLRLKGEMQSTNTAMRDPTLMRIIDHPHPMTSTRYRVWPTYDFENAVMDGIEGITHRLRTKEFELRNEVQKYIQRILGFEEAVINEFGRLNMEGIESSGRIIREKVKSGELLGWDDPSLTTLVALKRRGFQPAGIKDFLLATGITKNETTMTWEDLYAHNRKVIDKTANRHFFIENPKKITVKGAPQQTVELKLHPEDASRGKRIFHTKEEFLMTADDYTSLEKGKLYRFMDCANFIMQDGHAIYHSHEYEEYKKNGSKIMHWLPVSGDMVQVEVLMPDKSIAKGVAEPLVKSLNVDDVIQFERFGFCRLDRKGKDALTFWFTHK
jgi:glutamyl-tRNA synthetase